MKIAKLNHTIYDGEELLRDSNHEDDKHDILMRCGITALLDTE
jgi:hypothetical protein